MLGKTFDVVPMFISGKIKISYPIVRNAVGEADLNVVSWT